MIGNNIMQIEDTFIKDLKIIHLNKFGDERGSFIKTFNFDFYKESELMTELKESYYSISSKNVIRGMHFQLPPNEHVKIVYLNRGRILDVVLDIRKQSDTFGKFFATELDVDNPVLIYIPIGCAHGFKSLEEGSMVTYIQSSCYHPESDTGIRFDSFGMDWGCEKVIISNRDKSFMPFNRFQSPF
jgi:dTDP-4-dehydrorhamnose 3,5-epimerase/CDP-3, 6-dideoxy-D-glycero-D-glycero-4-hexulose-5-epimerase